MADIDIKYLDTLDVGDFHHLCSIKKDHWDDFIVTGNDEEDMATLKDFCTPDWPVEAKNAKNSDWQATVNFLRFVLFLWVLPPRSRIFQQEEE